MTPAEQRKLTEAERRIAEITAALHKAQGERDAILQQQLDHVGAHDQRYTTR